MPTFSPITLHKLVYPRYKLAKHHYLLNSLLTTAVSTPRGRLIISTPPQHNKSHWTSVLLPAWLLMTDPTKKIILLSYEAGLAHIHSEQARDIVTEWGPQLTGMHTKKDALARNRWLTTEGGYCQATSILGSVTGRPADVIIIDDPFKGDADANSPTIRDKVHRAFLAVARTRLSPDGTIIVIQTRWHPDDLVARILQTSEEPWQYVSLPALCTDPDKDLLHRGLGDPLWPERYPPEWYANTKHEYELQGCSYLWAALYQCDPTGDASTREWPHEYVKDILVNVPDLTLPTHSSLPQGGETYIHPYLPDPETIRLKLIAVDPSKGGTEDHPGDYSAILHTTLLHNGHLYIHADMKRRPPDQIEDDVILTAKHTNTDIVFMETNGFQEVLAANIQKKAKHLKVFKIDNRENKISRIRISLSPLLAQKRVHIWNTSQGRLLQQQLAEFPTGTHDDGPDSLEIATQGINYYLFGTKKPTPLLLKV